MTPLSLSHFLIKQLGGEVLPEVVSHLRKRWRRVQQLISQVWKSLRQIILPSLNVRSKWFTSKQKLKENDVVLVDEEL